MFKYLVVIFIFIIAIPVFAQDEDEFIKDISEAYELFSVGNFEEAAPLFGEIAAIMKENAKNDIKGRVRVNLYAGISYKEAGDYKNAYKCFSEAFTLAVSHIDKAYAMKILAYIAETERLLGEYGKAVSGYKAAIKSGLLNEKDIAALYYELAETYRLSGSYGNALNACEQSKEISERYSMERLLLSCAIIEGESYRMRRDYAKAMNSFGAAHDKARPLNYDDIVIAALNGLGLVSEALERTDAARDRFEDSLSISLKNGDERNIVLISDKIIALLPLKGNFDNKGDMIVKTSQEFNSDDSINIKIALLKLASAYYETSKSYDNMLVAATEVYEKAMEAEDDNSAFYGMYAAARAFYGINKYYESSVSVDEAISRAIASENYDIIPKLYILKSDCLIKTGDYDDASFIINELIASADDKDLISEYKSKLMEIERLEKADK